MLGGRSPIAHMAECKALLNGKQAHRRHRLISLPWPEEKGAVRPRPQSQRAEANDERGVECQLAQALAIGSNLEFVHLLLREDGLQQNGATLLWGVAVLILDLVFAAY